MTRKEKEFQVVLERALWLLGYAGYVPSIRAENLHGRTYGASTCIVAVNSKIHPGDLCPDRDPNVSDLNAYLEIRKQKETLRAAHVFEDTSAKCKHLSQRADSQGRQVTLSFDQIAQGSNFNTQTSPNIQTNFSQNGTALELKGALIRTRPNAQF